MLRSREANWINFVTKLCGNCNSSRHICSPHMKIRQLEDRCSLMKPKQIEATTLLTSLSQESRCPCPLYVTTPLKSSTQEARRTSGLKGRVSPVRVSY